MVLSEDGSQPSAEFCQQMSEIVMDFVRINNLILNTDYYKE
jgi:hypothetical protein